MKKTLVFAVFILLTVSFLTQIISAQNEPSGTPNLEGDVKKIQDITTQIPFNDQGGIDNGTFVKWKSKAEERIDEINTWVGPISNILFGQKLALDWVFVWAVILWLILIELVANPLKMALNMNYWLSLVAGGIVATISMHSWGDNLVNYINATITVWWMMLAAIFAAIAFAFFVYPFIWKFVEKKKKEMEAATLKLAEKKICRDSFKSSRRVI